VTDNLKNDPITPSIAANVETRNPSKLAPEYASYYYQATQLLEKAMQTLIGQLWEQERSKRDPDVKIACQEQRLYFQTKIQLLEEERAYFIEAMSQRN
jgi:hypothetical protein